MNEQTRKIDQTQKSLAILAIMRRIEKKRKERRRPASARQRVPLTVAE